MARWNGASRRPGRARRSRCGTAPAGTRRTTWRSSCRSSTRCRASSWAAWPTTCVPARTSDAVPAASADEAAAVDVDELARHVAAVLAGEIHVGRRDLAGLARSLHRRVGAECFLLVL